MDPHADVREIEVNVVSSPEECSRNNSPEPESYRLMGHMAPTNTITCFPLIKTGDDDSEKNRESVKSTPTSKTAGTSTNFSISSILSRSEPVAKKNGFLSIVPSGAPQSLLESTVAGNCPDSAMLSR